MITFQRLVRIKSYEIPLYACSISAGFPSPADDSLDQQLDLNDYLIQHPAATFFVRVSGHSMIGTGIHDGDILIVDRSLTPNDGKVVVAAVDGEMTVKRLCYRGNRTYLEPENSAYPPIELNEERDVWVWGVVVHVIHTV